jgi:hypothetical protein
MKVAFVLRSVEVYPVFLDLVLLHFIIIIPRPNISSLSSPPISLTTCHTLLFIHACMHDDMI